MSHLKTSSFLFISMNDADESFEVGNDSMTILY